MKGLLEVFLTFFKIGVLTFGGGYTMLPLLQKDVVQKLNWATNEEIIDYYAVSQSLPGLIAVNTAMLIGHKRGKTSGLVAATLGIAAPSIIIILVIASFIQNFSELESVKHAFNGIRVAVSVLILNTTVSMWKSSVKDKACVAIFLTALLVFTWVSISPIFPVIAGAVAGILLKEKKKEEKKERKSV
jgi:chromate transporter